jgi:hypothetical protein
MALKVGPAMAVLLLTTGAMADMLKEICLLLRDKFFTFTLAKSRLPLPTDPVAGMVVVAMANMAEVEAEPQTSVPMDKPSTIESLLPEGEAEETPEALIMDSVEQGEEMLEVPVSTVLGMEPVRGKVGPKVPAEQQAAVEEIQAPSVKAAAVRVHTTLVAEAEVGMEAEVLMPLAEAVDLDTPVELAMPVCKMANVKAMDWLFLRIDAYLNPIKKAPAAFAGALYFMASLFYRLS